MEFKQTRLPGVIVVEPRVFEDARGFFLESYNAAAYKDGGIHANFVQDNHSSSVKGTLRGLHMQWRKPQAKLIRCIEGEIFDVAVDARKGSPTFGKWIGATLSAGNRQQLFIPAGFLHGFCVLSDTAQVEYKCNDFYDPGGELTVVWDDPEIGIDWPLDEPVLSEKDAAGLSLSEVEDQLQDF